MEKAAKANNQGNGWPVNSMKAPLTSISNSCALCLLTPTALPISDDVALVCDDLQGCLKLTARANTIDFFRNPGVIRDAIRTPLSFVIDDSSQEGNSFIAL